MNINFQDRNATVTTSGNFRGETDISVDTNLDGVKLMLEAIYEKMNTEDLISTLDEDQIKEIVKYYEEELKDDK